MTKIKHLILILSSIIIGIILIEIIYNIFLRENVIGGSLDGLHFIKIIQLRNWIDLYL